MEEFASTALANCGKSIQVREVWNDNLEDEFTLIQEIVDDYPFIAMDTAHTGIVFRPVRGVKTNWDYNYRALKANVDYGKVIQLGLTFFDKRGQLPTGGTGDRCVWQFNFREFDPERDVFENDAIELHRPAGIDFKKNMEKGIAARQFAELLMSSGAVLNDSAGWVAFHGGYDFGYLLKLLTGKTLPDTKAGFLELADVFFPTLYDVKHLMKCWVDLRGGLNELAKKLKVERVGNICYQAGSDSLLTSAVFRKMEERFFDGDAKKHAGVLYGLGVEKGQNGRRNSN